jgi:hypothetical protein
MDFAPEQLAELRKMLNGVNVTDEHLSRGLRLTAEGTEKVAKRFGIQTSEVPQMIQACADMVAADLKEDSSRFSYEADYMGNLTLRDAESGEEVYLQGDEAFALAGKLEQHPDQEEVLISQYFDHAPLQESDETVPAVPARNHDGGTFNFPYRGKFATARYWTDEGHNFHLKVISLRDSEDNEEDITPELQAKLDAIAMTWVDKV